MTAIDQFGEKFVELMEIEKQIEGIKIRFRLEVDGDLTVMTEMNKVVMAAMTECGYSGRSYLK